MMDEGVVKLLGVQPKQEIVREDLRVVNLIARAPSGIVCPAYGEIWGLNHSWAYGHELDKLFIMDGLKAMMDSCVSENISQEEFKNYVRTHQHVELINAYPEKLTETKEVEGKTITETIAQCVQMPKHLTDRLIPGSYYTSSVAWVLAYCAVQEELGFKKVDTLNLYGVELWGSFDDSEYFEQKECVDFWIAYLYGRGTQVMIPAYTLKIAKSQNNYYGYIRK